MSEWIDVKHRLPEEGQECLVYGILETTGTFEIWKARFFHVNHTFENNNLILSREEFWEYEWCKDFEQVTHWMPLPCIPLKPGEIPLKPGEVGQVLTSEGWKDWYNNDDLYRLKLPNDF